MKLAPVPKRSLSDHVYEQLSNQIVAGTLQPGSSLPSERALTEALGVNRGAIREAVKRLAQAGLVSSQHGSGNKILDFRRSAGLDFLPTLLFRDGDVDPTVVRSVMELRSAIGPDAARLCAERNKDAADQLDEIVAKMTPQTPLATSQDLAAQFWEVLVDGSDNIAYRLAYNSMMSIYDNVREALAEVLADELRDVTGYRAIAKAVRHGSGFTAHCEAAALVERGLGGMTAAFAQLESIGG